LPFSGSHLLDSKSKLIVKSMILLDDFLHTRLVGIRKGFDTMTNAQASVEIMEAALVHIMMLLDDCLAVIGTIFLRKSSKMLLKNAPRFFFFF
jgi:hypothetical protein